MPSHHHSKKKKNKSHNSNNSHSGSTKELLQNNADTPTGGETSTAGLDDNSGGSKVAAGVPLKYKIAHCEEMGRYLVAASKIKAGELIINVEPIVLAPCADSEPVCLGCYIPISMKSADRKHIYKCPGCGWPLCSSRCNGYKTPLGHSTWECSLLRERRVADNLEKSSPLSAMYDLIGPLRCLLLQKHDPPRWQQLTQMEAHNELRRTATPALWERNQRHICDRLRHVWKCVDDFSDELIHTVCGYLEVNCFEIGQNGAKARAMYPEAFLLSHDCSPNTTHSDHPISHNLTVRVTRDLNPGDSITLSYAYTLQGTLKRRQHLNECKFFWCLCARCSDITELGTYSSALICPKCHNGLILPTNALQQTAPWQCIKCKYTVTANSMLLLLDKIYGELDEIDAMDVQGFEAFLDKYRNVLHKNHYLCVSAKHSLSELLGRSTGYLIQDLSLQDLMRKETYCRDILNVVDVLDPGLSRLRGVIMYELHAPIMLQATRLFEQKQINRAEFRQRLKEVVKLLKNSVTILSLEPEGSGEHGMAVAAKDALERIGKV